MGIVEAGKNHFLAGIKHPGFRPGQPTDFGRGTQRGDAVA